MFGQATMLFVFLFIIATAIVDSYTVRWPVVQRRTTSSTVLDMGKGFNNARSRQAELAKKMELAKMKQTESLSGTDEQPPVEEKIDGRDVDEDHKMFQRLLDTTKGALPTDTDTDSAFIAPIKAGQQKITQRIKKPSEPTAKQLAKQLEKAEIKDKEKRRIAQRIHFESLIDVQTSRQLGAIVAAQLVPWVPPYLNDCLIVFADPRTNSMDLRQAIKYLSSACSNLEDGNPQQQKIMDQVVVITADSDQEIQSWLKRSKLLSPIRIFSDPELAWMSEYNVLPSEGHEDDGGIRPWSMAVLTFDTNGDLIQQKRNVEPSHATQLVLDTIENIPKQ